MKLEWFKSANSKGKKYDGVRVSNNFIYFGAKMFDRVKDSGVEFGVDPKTSELLISISANGGFKVCKGGGNFGTVRSKNIIKWLNNLGVSGRYEVALDTEKGFWRGHKVD